MTPNIEQAIGGAGSLVGMGMLALPWNGTSLLSMLIYLWSREFSSQMVSIYGMFQARPRRACCRRHRCYQAMNPRLFRHCGLA